MKRNNLNMKFHIFILMLMIPFLVLSQTEIENDGMITIEAEDFFRQEKDEIRKWYIIDETTVLLYKGVDTLQCSAASKKAFIAVLPDTRTTHDDKLIPGRNFSNEPGQMAIISYKIQFANPGKYYVGVKAYSTGSEDNGIHVGLDGDWPESGQRMQWCEGKNQWTWASKQRTETNHCGEEGLIFLEIPSPGEHIVSFSMREDGFRFDKFALSKNYELFKILE